MSEPVFLVIGAAGGIGSATVRELRAKGTTVVLAGRDEEVSKRVKAFLFALESAFTRVLRSAQRRGELRVVEALVLRARMLGCM